MDKLGMEEAPPGTGAGMVQNKEIWAGVFGKGVQVLPTPGSCEPWGAAAPWLQAHAWDISGTEKGKVTLVG